MNSEPSGLGEIDVPDVVGLFAQADTADLGGARWFVEQAEIHALGVLRKESVVDAATVPGGAERVGLAGVCPQFHRASLQERWS